MFQLELGKIIAAIKEKGSKHVLIQLPDGLKPKAQDIIDRIEKETDAQAFVWFSSCFGACDLPQGLAALQIDLTIQWGHNRYHKTPGEW